MSWVCNRPVVVKANERIMRLSRGTLPATLGRGNPKCRDPGAANRVRGDPIGISAPRIAAGPKTPCGMFALPA